VIAAVQTIQVMASSVTVSAQFLPAVVRNNGPRRHDKSSAPPQVGDLRRGNSGEALVGGTGGSPAIGALPHDAYAWQIGSSVKQFTQFGRFFEVEPEPLSAALPVNDARLTAVT
jgi:hypothetical protein